MLVTFRRILSFWRHRRLLGAGLTTTMLLRTLFTVVLAVSVKAIIDGVTGEATTSTGPVVASLVAGFVISTAAGLVGGYLTAYASAAILSDVRTSVFEHLQRLSLGFHDRSEAGDLLAGFSTDIAQINDGVVRKPLEGLLSLVAAGFYFPVMLVLEPRLAVVAAAAMPTAVFLVNRLSPDVDAPLDAEKRREASVLSEVAENLGAQPVIRAFGLYGRARSRFDQRVAELRSTSVRAGFRVQILAVVSNFAVAFVQLVIVGIGAAMALGGSISAGTFAAFVALLTEFTWEATVIGSEVLPRIRQASSGIRRIDALLSAGPVIEEPAVPVRSPQIVEGIRFEQVQFSYSADGPPLLDGVDLHIPAGTFCAIVGPSGSGKSTLLSLILRFYDASGGRVLIDSIDVMDVDSTDLRRHMGVVFQDTFLFDAPLRENIVMDLAGVTDAEVDLAVAGSGLSDFVARLPDGLSTRVGSGGRKLSGGQRQRVGIARALVRRPQLLLLDEMTAALDPATEQAVNDTVSGLRGGRTIVAVTHRLAPVEDADLIVVLDDGRIVETGSFDELRAAGGTFARLWEKQHGFTVSGDGLDATVHSDRLKRIPLFAELNDDRLIDLADRLRSETFRENEDVFAQGDPGDRFYVIARGTAAVIATVDGSERTLAQLEDGDFFGEMALLDDAPRNATIRTTTPMTTLSLDRAGFEDLLGGADAAADAVRRTAAARAEQNLQR